MGRTLKRVPLDFSWPHNKVWGGYVNPYYQQSAECPDCGGSGYSPRAKVIADQWYNHLNEQLPPDQRFNPFAYGAKPLQPDHPAILEQAQRNVTNSPDFYLSAEEWEQERRQRARLQTLGEGDPALVKVESFRQPAIEREARRLWGLWRNAWGHNLIQADVDALIAANRLWDFTRVPRTEEQREVVRAKIAAGGNNWLPESNGYTPTADEVNDWSMRDFGHDSLNSWICVKARCAREGVPLECANPAASEDHRIWPSAEVEAAYKAWEESEPPEGPGFQLWETTSEGSPVSPVFATLEELCEYAAEHCTTFASFKVSAAKWREMLEDDFVHHAEGNNIYV